MINTIKKTVSGLAIASFTLFLIACSPKKELHLDPELQQAVFATPSEAAQVFADAVEAHDTDTLAKLLGQNYQQVLPVDKISKSEVQAFISGWKSEHDLLERNEKTQFIEVGKSKWIMPIPLVMTDKKTWYFDVKQGTENMTLRRIGKNELYAIQAVLTYKNAQIEYAKTDHDGNGILEYAQKLISTPGKQDGLIWPGNTNHYATQLAKLLSDRSKDGSYHGYHYKILHAEQSGATQENYMVNGLMTKGFALIAWPIAYGDSGIMTFLLSKKGVVYQTDLGQDTAAVAAKIITYDPNTQWHKTDEASLKP